MSLNDLSVLILFLQRGETTKTAYEPKRPASKHDFESLPSLKIFMNVGKL